ncbi:DNA polymerase IV [soil metagenome]
MNAVRIIGHVDLDAFFAAVEELERPELRAQPLVVGGDPHGRGVVSTANYEARRYGIRSAMSCAEALRRCPRAVFVLPRHDVYAAYSREVWAVVRQVVPTVERTGLDEGYLDLGEIADSFSRARALAEAVQVAVRGATSLSCSVGVASCKLVAKVASDRRKPGGLTVVPAGREAEFLAPFAVRLLTGIGPKTAERMTGAGVTTVGALASLDDDRLGAVLPPKLGRHLRRRASGLDATPLAVVAESVSIGHEETFARDGGEPELLHAELMRMSVRVADRLKATGQTARTVTTKVRYPDFSLRTRSQTLPVGTDAAQRIGEIAGSLLDKALSDRPEPLRLVGVSASKLERRGQLELSLAL